MSDNRRLMLSSVQSDHITKRLLKSCLKLDFNGIIPTSWIRCVIRDTWKSFDRIKFYYDHSTVRQTTRRCWWGREKKFRRISGHWFPTFTAPPPPFLRPFEMVNGLRIRIRPVRGEHHQFTPGIRSGYIFSISLDLYHKKSKIFFIVYIITHFHKFTVVWDWYRLTCHKTCLK